MGLRIVRAMLMAGAALSAAGLPAAAQEARPVAVESIAGVYVAPPPTALDKQALRQLKLGMKQMYGVELKDVADLKGLAAEQSVIILGRKAAVAAGLVSDDELAKVSPGGYVIKCGGKRIAIAGEDGWSTYFGVLGFLEQQGMRFYVNDPAKAYVPKVDAKVIQPFSVAERPVFAFRNGWSLLHRQCHRLLGDPRKGLNPELFTSKAGSDLWIDHSAGYLVPKRLYYDDHPAYYAMGKDGKRVAKNAFSDHRTPLCLSNPDVTRISIERALAWIEMNPDQKFFMITYGDTGLWCQCPECLKLDPAPGEYATRLLHWVNAVAKAVAAKHPDKILFTFAYGGSDKVPPKARPAKNVWIVVATGCGCYSFWDHALAQSGAGTKKILDWLAIAPGQVTVCEYLGAYEPAMIDKMTGRLRYYAKIGLRGVNATYGSPINFRPVWRYVWPKMCWNPQQDGQALAKDFIRFHYGPAAEPIVRFFELSHQRYQATLASKEKLTEAAYPPSYYSPQFARAAKACFDEAIGAVGDNPAMKKKLQKEAGLFLGNLVAHLPSYDFTEASNEQLLEYLGYQRELAKETGAYLPFLRETQALAMRLEKKKPGYRDLIGTWLGASTEMQPIQLANGLRFTPQMFMWCDYGPGPFPGGQAKSHPDFPCPPKLCAGVFMKTRGGHGQTTSSRMVLDFRLDAARAGAKAVLDIEGQDAISHWMGDRGHDWKTSIKILLNDKEVFSGECGFVRGNWSRRQFAVPAGLLKAGKNRLEIRNISGRGWYAGCWFLLSDARLIFAKSP